jgi:hypothetical protein
MGLLQKDLTKLRVLHHVMLEIRVVISCCQAGSQRVSSLNTRQEGCGPLSMAESNSYCHAMCRKTWRGGKSGRNQKGWRRWTGLAPNQVPIKPRRGVPLDSSFLVLEWHISDQEPTTMSSANATTVELRKAGLPLAGFKRLSGTLARAFWNRCQVNIVKRDE